MNKSEPIRKPAIEELIEPFLPYIKYGNKGIVYFINGSELSSKDFGLYCWALWPKSKESFDIQYKKYCDNVEIWCKSNIR